MQAHSPASERGDNERACPATDANEEEFCVTLTFPETGGTLTSVLWGPMGKGEPNFWGKGGWLEIALPPVQAPKGVLRDQ